MPEIMPTGTPTNTTPGGGMSSGKIALIVVGGILLLSGLGVWYLSTKVFKSLEEAKNQATETQEAVKNSTGEGVDTTYDTKCYKITVPGELLRVNDKTFLDEALCSAYGGLSFYAVSTDNRTIDEVDANTKIGKTASEEIKEKKKITINGKQALWVSKQTVGPDGVTDGDKIIKVTIDSEGKYKIGSSQRNIFTFTFYDVELPKEEDSILTALNNIVWK